MMLLLMYIPEKPRGSRWRKWLWQNNYWKNYFKVRGATDGQMIYKGNDIAQNEREELRIIS